MSQVKNDTDYLHLSNPSPLESRRAYGFATAIIVGIGGLAVGGVGAAGYFGTISNLNQVHAIIMMAAGSGGGAILFIVGVVGTVKNCKTGSGSNTHSLHGNRDLRISSKRQTEFIQRTSRGEIRDTQRFGKAEWETYFEDVGDEPPLPENFEAILNSPCPFSKDESVRVKDTHMLVLIPKTVNKKYLTLNRLQTLLEDHKIIYNVYSAWVEQEIGTASIEQASYWVLMTRDVVPGSRNKKYDCQQALVNQHKDYRLPKTLEAAVCILMEHVSSGSPLFYDEERVTYTRCLEIVNARYSVMVRGGDNFYVDYCDILFHYNECGVAALREL